MTVRSVKAVIRDCIAQGVSRCALQHVRVVHPVECASLTHFNEQLRRCLHDVSANVGESASNSWLLALPSSLLGTTEEVINYLGMLVAIDFRHWAEDGERETLPGSRVRGYHNFYATPTQKDTRNGSALRGSMAMVYILRQAVEAHGLHWYRPELLLRFKTVEEATEGLRCCFVGHKGDGQTPMWIPAKRERVELLLSLASALVERKTSFYKMWRDSECYLYHPTEVKRGFIEQLLQLHPRYRDVCVLSGSGAENASQVGEVDVLEIPVLKLAQLTAIAIDSVLPFVGGAGSKSTHNDFRYLPHQSKTSSIAHPGAFLDKHQLTICCDYQIPKALRHLGLIEYDAYLATLVDEGVPLVPGGKEECAIRVGALIASEMLLEYLNNGGLNRGEALRGLPKKWDGPAIDHMLWYIGRNYVESSIKHHLCYTTMY
ncbi:putative Queuosine Q salvage protein family [Trypanosoma vivax]|nr:hypothetical protein TRVL_02936 [Trypanosoma vivax]KAH8611638.1 putative Queuosine Q salvage protein family [Trypanosoma vivax]